MHAINGACAFLQEHSSGGSERASLPTWLLSAGISARITAAEIRQVGVAMTALGAHEVHGREVKERRMW